MRFATVDLVAGSQIADCPVQALTVVTSNVILYDTPGIGEGKWRFGTYAFLLESGVKALNFAVALRIVRRRSDVGHTADANELLELFGNELRSVVGNDAGTLSWTAFPGPLEDNFDVRFGH